MAVGALYPIKHTIATIRILLIGNIFFVRFIRLAPENLCPKAGEDGRLPPFVFQGWYSLGNQKPPGLWIWLPLCLDEATHRFGTGVRRGYRRAGHPVACYRLLYPERLFRSELHRLVNACVLMRGLAYSFQAPCLCEESLTRYSSRYLSSPGFGAEIFLIVLPLALSF